MNEGQTVTECEDGTCGVCARCVDLPDSEPMPERLPEPGDAPDLAYLMKWAERSEYAATTGGYGSFVVAILKKNAAHLRCAIAALTP